MRKDWSFRLQSSYGTSLIPSVTIWKMFHFRSWSVANLFLRGPQPTLGQTRLNWSLCCRLKLKHGLGYARADRRKILLAAWQSYFAIMLRN
jgi:hypothetical protein